MEKSWKNPKSVGVIFLLQLAILPVYRLPRSDTHIKVCARQFIDFWSKKEANSKGMKKEATSWLVGLADGENGSSPIGFGV